MTEKESYPFSYIAFKKVIDKSKSIDEYLFFDIRIKIKNKLMKEIEGIASRNNTLVKNLIYATIHNFINFDDQQKLENE